MIKIRQTNERESGWGRKRKRERREYIEEETVSFIFLIIIIIKQIEKRKYFNRAQ
jgi:hypothetical protein